MLTLNIIKLVMQEEGIKPFYYHFDSRDFLQRIYVGDEKNKELIFERDRAISEAKDEYYLSLPEKSAAM